MNRSMLSAMAAIAELINNELTDGFIGRVSAVLSHCMLRTKGKIMICGNGGSACDAMHFAEELTGRYEANRPSIPAIACSDIGHITCTANDFGYEHVFERWVDALGKPQDVLIVLSTSGNSENVIRAAIKAKEKRMATIALLGKDGGKLKGICDHEFVVPGENSARIQELHMLLLHIFAEQLEEIASGH